ncbi:MAG TPA: hypothetical protein VIT20_00870 [Propionibacteriaceae bacterium]
MQVTTWIVAILLAFIVVSTRDGGAPLPATATLTVTSWDGTGTAADLRRGLDQYARDQQITIAQEVADFDNRGAVRHLYLVDGDPAVPGAAWIEDGIGDFGGTMTTVVHPLLDAQNRSPLGAYDVFGADGKAAALAPFFAEHGATIETTQLGAVGSIPRSVLLVVAVLMLLTVSMLGALVVASMRRYAVARLHGIAYSGLLSADLRRYASRWMLCGVAVLGVSVPLVTILFGSAGVGLFAATAVAIQLGLLLAAAVAQAIFLSMVTSIEIPSAMKGDLPSRALTFAAYGLRALGMVIALATITTTFTLAADVASRDQSRAAFERLGSTSALTLGNAYTTEDQDRLDDVVGPWLRDVDRRHQLILAAQQTMAADVAELRGASVLLVNENFLREQPVRLSDGGDAQQLGSDRITVLVPESRWAVRDQVRAGLDLDVQLQPGSRPQTQLQQYPSGETFFTYAPASGPSESVQNWDSTATQVTDPVLVVVPSERGWLSDASYVAFASQGGALLTDPGVVNTAVGGNAELERFIRGVTPVADKAAAALTEQSAQLRMALFTALIACFVVATSGIAAATIHTRRMAQRAFVRHLFGWSFAAIYRFTLVVEALVLAALIGWLPWRVGAQRRELEVWQSAGVPLPVDLPTVEPTQLAALALLAILTTGSYVFSLAYAHRRVVRGGASAA